MRIETRYDCLRGCGWRKPGGKYLVAGSLCLPCGKLPLGLCRCPVCDAGIKPGRGFAWIAAKVLFVDSTCGGDNVGESHFCDGCLLRKPPNRAGLLWIGGQFYATPESYCREAATLGISRRIAQIPKGLIVGETLVLLAHREVEFAWGTERPGIFAAFVPQAIEYVVTGSETEEELERLVKQGCTPVRIVRSETDEASQPSACDEPAKEGQTGLWPEGHGSGAGGLESGGGAGEAVPEVPPELGVGTPIE